ncbi:hypothetical protein CALCODRAFT_304031 [Calocera cornea HHB12733]|uniref:Uncharacterized protein n=1 Tax=Calocera cornea HHB12733 TaxID=1353952 RepID=A0A165JKR9_9BASI|nr:hypothetical protein CALCODRAFT_304031 [Calocera cornea HHB12733]
MTWCYVRLGAGVPPPLRHQPAVLRSRPFRGQSGEEATGGSLHRAVLVLGWAAASTIRMAVGTRWRRLFTHPSPALDMDCARDGRHRRLGRCRTAALPAPLWTRPPSAHLVSARDGHETQEDSKRVGSRLRNELILLVAG